MVVHHQQARSALCAFCQLREVERQIEGHVHDA
jgi:hypothetical protein